MGRTPRLATALVAAAVLAVAGCGGGSSAAAPATAAPTTSHDMAGMTTGDHSMDMAPTKAATNAGFGDCAQHMPGELLTPEEAVVRFDTQMVCLGYVTVTTGTPIAWTNNDTAEQTVTILDDEDRELNEFTVDAGETITTPAASTGVYRFHITAIDSFTGTIEVQ